LRRDVIGDGASVAPALCLMAAENTGHDSIQSLFDTVSHRFESYGAINITSEEWSQIINEVARASGKAEACCSVMKRSAERRGVSVALGCWVLLCSFDILAVWPDPLTESQWVSCSICTLIVLFLLVFAACSEPRRFSSRSAHVFDESKVGFAESGATGETPVMDTRALSSRRGCIMAVHTMSILGCFGWLTLHAVTHRGPQVWTGVVTFWALVCSAPLPDIKILRVSSKKGEAQPLKAVEAEASLEIVPNVLPDDLAEADDLGSLAIFCLDDECSDLSPRTTLREPKGKVKGEKWSRIFDARGSCTLGPVVGKSSILPISIPPEALASVVISGSAILPIMIPPPAVALERKPSKERMSRSLIADIAGKVRRQESERTSRSLIAEAQQVIGELRTESFSSSIGSEGIDDSADLETLCGPVEAQGCGGMATSSSKLATPSDFSSAMLSTNAEFSEANGLPRDVISAPSPVPLPVTTILPPSAAAGAS